jgi:hypothetical protein
MGFAAIDITTLGIRLCRLDSLEERWARAGCCDKPMDLCLCWSEERAQGEDAGAQSISPSHTIRHIGLAERARASGPINDGPAASFCSSRRALALGSPRARSGARTRSSWSTRCCAARSRPRPSPETRVVPVAVVHDDDID